MKPYQLHVKTIDVLILESLLQGPLTVDDLSRMWSEDILRVIAWVERFRDLDLVRFRQPLYFANPDQIREYMVCREAASP